MSFKQPAPVDFYGQAILLETIISKLADEITADVCRDHPSLVCLAIAGMASRAKMLVDEMTESIGKDKP
jgi:hypothetical protein